MVQPKDATEAQKTYDDYCRFDGSAFLADFGKLHRLDYIGGVENTTCVWECFRAILCKIGTVFGEARGLASGNQDFLELHDW